MLEMFYTSLASCQLSLAQIEVEMGRITGCEKVARVEECVGSAAGDLVQGHIRWIDHTVCRSVSGLSVWAGRHFQLKLKDFLVGN